VESKVKDSVALSEVASDDAHPLLNAASHLHGQTGVWDYLRPRTGGGSMKPPYELEVEVISSGKVKGSWSCPTLLQLL
jgi:hypothetical protein